jgi:hypothetical protein
VTTEGTAADYSLLRPPLEDWYCGLYELPGSIKNSVLPSRGESIVGLFDDVRDYRMSKQVRGIQVPDVIENTFSFLMVSERMKKLIETNAIGARIEYVRFRLINHKGRVAADPCFIVNVLGTIDCADRSKSVGVETAIYKGEYSIARKLLLVDGRLPKDSNIFRTALFPSGVWVRSDLRKAMEQLQPKVRFVASGEEI